MHTPGPWTVFDEKWGIGVTTDCADIAHCGGFDTNRSRDEERANARLIAAAPDLLAALSECFSFIGTLDQTEGSDRVWQIARAAIAQVAIDQAKGE